ncbi:MAG: ActS/PrrB/RegB family redox-sensitive histidine kinase [Cypionkella sp.]
MPNQRDKTAEAYGFLPERSDWLRLRTLILLRWTAIVGQLVALGVATQVYGMQIPLGLCFLAIGLAVIANLVSIFIFPENKRLTEAEALLTLLFDLAQLCFLLYLTGGLTNPFVVLILAPVAVSASALELRSTVVLGLAAAVLVTLVALLKMPLHYADGSLFQVPPLFTFGFWIALVIGIVFLGGYSRRIATEMQSMSNALMATQMALAREQKLTDLGGVIAAAAHELGTPLATIKLVSTELFEELSDRPDLAEDASLIREQADRCRDILRAMGKAGNDDLHMHQAPLSIVVREAAEPHLERGIAVEFSLQTALNSDAQEPQIERRPELIHGLRNLVQNAVDFAQTRVWIDMQHSEDQIKIRISDDGQGYPAQVIGRIGDPFVRSRSAPKETGQEVGQEVGRRPGYEGMGLGLFIAKTLLERTGARLTFANGTDPFLQPEERPARKGAIVEVVWPLTAISADVRGGLGANRAIEA